MPSSVSIRVYLLTLRRRSSRTKLLFDELNDKGGVSACVTKFISACSTVTERVDKERSWYFEEKIKGSSCNSKGYIHYGTFGYESNLVDTKTKKKNYQRQVTDSEIIPLFYEFWRPSKASHIFIAFQSFQGKSCVHLVMSKLQETFQAAHPEYILTFKKLIPNDSSGSIYKSYPVQKLTLIKNGVSTDLADHYTGTRPSEPVNLEVSLVARRKGSVGMFGSIARMLKSEGTGVITHEGVDFDEARANVRVGGRTRAVGIFGGNSEAGVIDLSDTVERGANGHPEFKSLLEEVSSILKDFQTIVEDKA